MRRENVLLPNEILTAIDVPNAPAGSKAIYIKEMVREVYRQSDLARHIAGALGRRPPGRYLAAVWGEEQVVGDGS